MIIYIYITSIYILLYTVIVVHRTLILPMFSAITNFNTRIISWAAQSRPGSWYVASSATESSTRCLGRQRRRKRRFEIVGNTMGNILNWLIQQLWRMDKDGPCADDLQMNSLFNTAIFQGYLSWLEGTSIHLGRRSRCIKVPHGPLPDTAASNVEAILPDHLMWLKQ